MSSCITRISTQTDERIWVTSLRLKVHQNQKERVLHHRKIKDCVKIRLCKNTLGASCVESSCDFWLPPMRWNDKSESRCKYDDECIFQHNETFGRSSKKSKNDYVKGSKIYVKGTVQQICVSQHSSHRNSILQKSWLRIILSSCRRSTCVTLKLKKKKEPIADSHTIMKRQMIFLHCDDFESSSLSWLDFSLIMSHTFRSVYLIIRKKNIPSVGTCRSSTRYYLIREIFVEIYTVVLRDRIL